jgi:hypothetical protein
LHGGQDDGFLWAPQARIGAVENREGFDATSRGQLGHFAVVSYIIEEPTDKNIKSEWLNDVFLLMSKIEQFFYFKAQFFKKSFSV